MRRMVFIFTPALALLLAGCSITLQPGNAAFSMRVRMQLSPVIQRFEAERGAGSGYQVGESVHFFIALSQPGYITLVALDPGGQAYEFQHSRYLSTGTHVLPPYGAHYQYTVTYPTGLERVRAIYTSTPGPLSVRFHGIFTSSGLNSHTELYFEQSSAQVRDIADTYFYINP